MPSGRRSWGRSSKMSTRPCRQERQVLRLNCAGTARGIGGDRRWAALAGAAQSAGALPKDVTRRGNSGRANRLIIWSVPKCWVACQPTPWRSPETPTAHRRNRPTFTNSRANFLALMFCLMVGTAGLPHLLTRYYTTPSVAEARSSVAWSLFFIALLYLSAPALAVLVKYEVMAHMVGQPLDALPSWVAQWTRDPLAAGGARCQWRWHIAVCRAASGPGLGGAGNPRNRRLAVCGVGAWWPRGAWLRRCPRPMGCC